MQCVLGNWTPSIRSTDELLSCVVPDIAVFHAQWQYVHHVHEVPLSLVRDDGVIYSTGMSFTYTPEIGATRLRQLAPQQQMPVGQPPPSAKHTPTPINY